MKLMLRLGSWSYHYSDGNDMVRVYLFGVWTPFVLCTLSVYAEWERVRRLIREQHAEASKDGNWDYDPFAHGLYTGLERALALIENRNAEKRIGPDQWLCERRFVNGLPGFGSADLGVRFEYSTDYDEHGFPRMTRIDDAKADQRDSSDSQGSNRQRQVSRARRDRDTDASFGY